MADCLTFPPVDATCRVFLWPTTWQKHADTLNVCSPFCHIENKIVLILLRNWLQHPCRLTTNRPQPLSLSTRNGHVSGTAGDLQAARLGSATVRDQTPSCACHGKTSSPNMATASRCSRLSSCSRASRRGPTGGYASLLCAPLQSNVITRQAVSVKQHVS